MIYKQYSIPRHFVHAQVLYTALIEKDFVSIFNYLYGIEHILEERGQMKRFDVLTKKHEGYRLVFKLSKGELKFYYDYDVTQEYNPLQKTFVDLIKERKDKYVNYDELILNLFIMRGYQDFLKLIGHDNVESELYKIHTLKEYRK